MIYIKAKKIGWDERHEIKISLSIKLAIKTECYSIVYGYLSVDRQY